MAEIRIHGGEGTYTKQFEAPARLSQLLDGLDMPCGGRERCLKCRVRVKGNVSQPKERERALLGEDAYRAGERYACMTMAEGDLEVFLPEKKNDRIVTAGEMAAFTPDPWGTGYGIAVDIGTTTIAAYLYRLSDAALLQSFSAPNPQAGFGADVISRMEKSMNGEADALRKSVTDCLRSVVEAFLARESLAAGDISSMTITGNTAMLYLLTGRDPAPIAKLPFEMDHAFGEFTDPGQFGLTETAKVYLMKCMSAYVGADISAAITAAGLIRGGKLKTDGCRLLVDIGTNGEMALVTGGRLYVCSTAAGPAFEGAGITMGMTAREGAISRVDYKDGQFVIGTISGTPKGLCGTGIIDAVAAMLDAGILDETGLIQDEDHPFEDYIDEEDETMLRIPGTEVCVSQADVRAVQLAKSAICAGMKTLMHAAGVGPDDVDELIIAGGFGSFIRPESAERIGLIPGGFAKKARAIGNAAGAGASMALLSRACRDDSDSVYELAETIDLSTNKVFMEEYVNGMMFE